MSVVLQEGPLYASTGLVPPVLGSGSVGTLSQAMSTRPANTARIPLENQDWRRVIFLECVFITLLITFAIHG